MGEINSLETFAENDKNNEGPLDDEKVISEMEKIVRSPTRTRVCQNG